MTENLKPSSYIVELSGFSFLPFFTLRGDLEVLILLLEEKHDKIDVNRLKEGTERRIEVQGDIGWELGFLQEI